MKKKIIIQSESTDASTDDVIAWLNYYGHLDKTIVFLDDSPISKFSFNYTGNGLTISINGVNFTPEDSYWYRRGGFSTSQYLKSQFKEVNHYLSGSQLRSISSVLDALLCKKQLNCYNDNFIEKLQMLRDAHKVGLVSPPTLFTDSLDSVKDFINEHQKIITKTTIVPFGTVTLDKTYKFSSGTIKLNVEDLDGKPSRFLPSIFQKYMEKKYEIRTLYLDGGFYSMAIFSQMNEKTQVDCREKTNLPLRKTPYRLPIEYEENLAALMKLYSLNSCSIDTIVTPDNEFYFLEINPIGQFQWLSKNCNYQIEEKIANYLMQEDE